MAKPERAEAATEFLCEWGKGIGKLAERLIVEHPTWTCRRVAQEVNARIEGAKTSEKSVRWYASRMRALGVVVPNRRKNQA